MRGSSIQHLILIVGLLAASTNGREIKPEEYDILPEDCGASLSSDRIYGGNSTSIGEFPWMALLQYRTEQELDCAGSLITKRYVLTAAHCLIRENGKKYDVRKVRLGEYKTDEDPDCQDEHCADALVTIDVEEKIPHKRYLNMGLVYFEYDIGMVRMAQDAPFSHYIKPICLPRSDDVQSEFVVTGWGTTENGDPKVLLKVSLPQIDSETCFKYFPTTINETRICAGGRKGKDSCQGDSGGPLMQPEQDSDGAIRWTEVGIVSHGRKCGVQHWPGIYTKVYPFMPWIIHKMKP